MKKKILIVEDSPTQAILLENILQINDFEVAIAENGKRAMDWLSNNQPSLIISDIEMPVMNGFDLCCKVKSHDETAHIPVILLTALVDTSEVIRGLASGADSFVAKPYEVVFLMSIIQRLLKESDETTVSTVSECQENKEKKSIDFSKNSEKLVKLLLSVYEGAIHQNSKLKRAQEELLQLNVNLESLVFERTAKLSDEIETRKKIEMELRESEKRVELAVESAEIGMWDLDLKTNAIWRSNRHDQIFGFETMQNEWNKDLFQSHILPDDHDYVKKAFEEACNNKSLHFECRIKDAQGNIKWISEHGLIQKDKQGKPIRILGTILDITERKNAEIAIQKRMDDLMIYNRMAVGRELKMVELKKEINELLKEMGQEKRYGV